MANVIVAGENVAHKAAFLVELAHGVLAPLTHVDVALSVAAHARGILEAL